MKAIPRTCTELRRDANGRAEPADARPLEAFRDCPAYVLLGDPGMGKTTAFREEEDALGEAALFVTARDFITFDVDHHPEWRGKTLLIDGLDEIRTGTSDQRLPIDKIRGKLDQLGKPPFRLSCRHADWLETDQRSLEAVASSGAVTVLRLDPIRETDAAVVLANQTAIEDADDFIDQARQRRLHGMLTNPQSLMLLAQAVRTGRWPQTRSETFEKACHVMAAEHNDEHLSVHKAGDTNAILDAAGQVCATLLLSGRPGCATTQAVANDDYPLLTEFGHPVKQCLEAVASKLFHFPAPGRAAPVHRHVAEYLAARHIGSLIEDGLPVGRATALMSAPDGKIASEVRGLSAWLAVHCGLARRDLIARDPIGLALYGDIQTFSSDEQQALFDSLVLEPRELEPTLDRAPAFASLATPAMRSTFERTLVAPPDDGDGQIVVDFVLCVLREAAPLEGLPPLFLDIVRDRKRWPRVRDAALAAFVHYNTSGLGDSDLVALLEDIKERRVTDPNDELLGQLLSALYPRQVGPAMVWEYLKDPAERYTGVYKIFWAIDLADLSSDRNTVECLDELHNRFTQLEQVGRSVLAPCVARLLARALPTHGDGIETPRLYDWLDMAVRLGVGIYRNRGDEVIRRWVGKHSERHVDIMLEGLRRPVEEHWYAPYEAFRRLFGANVSPAFYESCARASHDMVDSRPQTAESLLAFAVQRGGIDPKRAHDLIGGNARLAGILDSLVDGSPTVQDRHRQGPRQAQHAKLQEESRRATEYFRANRVAFLENRAPANALHDLAWTYFDPFVNFKPEEGERRLGELVHRDPELLDIVMTGLRGATDRHDMPDVDTMLALRRQSQMHSLCLPYLVGLAEAERVGTLGADWWTTGRARTALTIYLGYAHGNYSPAWYGYLIERLPEVVAGVQIELARASFREGTDPVSANLSHLAFDPHHARVAKYASIPLLCAFPLRASNQLLNVLDDLLLAAYQHADRKDFLQLIERKLSRRSLPHGHRGRWLAAGCAVATSQYEDAAAEFVRNGRRQERALHFASFFCPRRPIVFPLEPRNARLARLLIELVGPYFGPEEVGEEWTTGGMRASMLVGRCIRLLGNVPHAEAADALSTLRAAPSLERWHSVLAPVSDDQQAIRRDYEYRHPTIAQVNETLRRGTPANPADLAALALDRLNAIRTRIRSTNTDDWKRHWNEDRNRRASKPKHEESCTQALIADLRKLLPSGVGAEPEPKYPNDKRADIRVSHGDIHVPIEVKRNDNEALWSALRQQLVEKYVPAAGTGGHGIYLVLWFGHERTKRSPTGQRPTGPDELKRQLEAALTDAEQRKISVCVMDVSPPAGQPSASVQTVKRRALRAPAP